MNPPVYHFCTYFDINYLTRGLALYESLRQHCRKPFVLWVLCFDDESHALLARLKLSGMELITQAEFEAGDTALIAIKQDRTRVAYYWTCTPSLPLYVLAHHPEVEIVTYLDADLYFYSDPQPIYDEIGSASILITEHRYAPKHAYLARTSGKYNVGWLSFHRDANGLACLHWWRERCLEWCHAYYEDGKFGDQLYLDDWPERFAGVAVLQHKGAGLAPWNLAQYNLQGRQTQLTVDGQPLIFFHFHGFRCVHARVVEPASHGYVFPPFAAQHIFLPYALALSRLAEKMRQPFVDKGHDLPPGKLCTGLLDQRLLLTRPLMVAVGIWRLAGWRRESRERVASGFAAYQGGDIRLMRRLFTQAIVHNPLVLANVGIVSLLVESMVGQTAMARYRTWRHGG